MANQSIAVNDIRNEVKRLIAEVTERETSEISDTADFIQDLEIDSLMAIEILVSVDKKYKIEIPEDEFRKILNINDAVEAVQRHLAQASAKAQ